MKKCYSFKLVILLSFLMVLFSCELFFEEDLSQESVVILAPADNVVLDNSDVYFWWEELEGTDQYCLQIVYPTFEAVEGLIADTLIMSNKIQMNLAPGEYQWRVKAVNGYFSSNFSLGFFKVDTFHAENHAIEIDLRKNIQLFN